HQKKTWRIPRRCCPQSQSGFYRIDVSALVIYAKFYYCPTLSVCHKSRPVVAVFAFRHRFTFRSTKETPSACNKRILRWMRI
ncbi:hypothetical protein M514_23661, partial [Trichuris suis]